MPPGGHPGGKTAARRRLRADGRRLILHRLCLHFGYPCVHPDVLAEVLTERQLDDWLTYAEVEPFGTPADDYRAALAAWAALSPHAGRRRLTPEQFVPKWGPADPPDPAGYKARAMAAYARAAPGN